MTTQAFITVRRYVSVDVPETVDILRTPEAGARVIRGGTLRGGGYLVGVLLAAATSVLLLRYRANSMWLIGCGALVGMASMMLASHA